MDCEMPKNGETVNFLSTHNTRAYLVIWFGQFLSVVGSGMTSFLVAIWSYRVSWSIQLFSLIILAATLPSIVMGPFAGALVDRWSKRNVLAVSVVGQAAATGFLALLFSARHLETYWQVYPAVVLISAFGAFQGPALTAVGAGLLPKELYSRAIGLWQINQAAVTIISPLLAVAIIPFVHMSGVIYIDAASYLFALASLWLVKLPSMLVEGRPDAVPGVRSFLGEISGGWKFISRHAALLQLLAVQSGNYLVYGMVQILWFPLVVTSDSVAKPAIMTACSTVGMIFGSLLMSTWRGPARQINGVLVSGLLAGAALIVVGAQQVPVWLACALLAFRFFIPMGQTCGGALWMKKAPSELLGRMSALTGTVYQLCLPLACLIAPPLSDGLFKPLLRPDGTPAEHELARIFGTGSLGGSGLMISALGVINIAIALCCWLSSRLQHMEQEIADTPQVAGDLSYEQTVVEPRFPLQAAKASTDGR
jgi:DHA3 family macrolide efflux protein-like MFS transporter